jgi:hypothetical protein
MRKLILIAVIATMSSSACYANLSLASNESPQEPIAQPGLHASETRAEAPVATVKSPNVSKPEAKAPVGSGFCGPHVVWTLPVERTRAAP